jgi:hypothetical protein
MNGFCLESHSILTHFWFEVGHGLLNRWTDFLFLPDQPGGEAFNPNNATQTQSIFVKLKKKSF